MFLDDVQRLRHLGFGRGQSVRAAGLPSASRNAQFQEMRKDRYGLRGGHTNNGILHQAVAHQSEEFAAVIA
jgi:hypothetical protein